MGKWINLGNFETIENLSTGEITSLHIIPNEYEVLTFDSSNRILDGDFTVFNGVTANGDGVNDNFIIQGIA